MLADIGDGVKKIRILKPRHGNQEMIGQIGVATHIYIVSSGLKFPQLFREQSVVAQELPGADDVDNIRFFTDL